MEIKSATDPQAWDSFIARQSWKPFLQSWTMGDVYKDVGQEPIRLTAEDASGIRAICFAHVVDAKRGKHLSVPYGPLFDDKRTSVDFDVILPALFTMLKQIAKQKGCSFIRMSPFLRAEDSTFTDGLRKASIRTSESPLHLLAEHIWYLPLKNPDGSPKKEEELLAAMRKTTRNLIGRAGRDGVTITASENPVRDLPLFIELHDETRKRHGFTPYTNDFFRAQVARFAPRKECTLYLAHYQGQVIAASIHMHALGETSYHHGASRSEFSKIPSSYLLQWTAITDALKRGDTLYNFWGIAPPDGGNPKPETRNPKPHPFAGVTLFKTGFGGELLNLMHCIDLPVTPKYWLTYWFETLRKKRRGF